MTLETGHCSRTLGADVLWLRERVWERASRRVRWERTKTILYIAGAGAIAGVVLAWFMR